MATTTSNQISSQSQQQHQQSSIAGEVFMYAQGRVAFENTSPNIITDNKCILLGGLSDGIMPVPYTIPLVNACKEIQSNKWSVIQPILSSSYTGFGHGTLDRDVEELDELIQYLQQYRNGKNFAIIGHSTGTQDIVHYLKYGQYKDSIRFVALQAPVSDREASTICHDCHESDDEHMKDLNMYMNYAIELRNHGKGDEMMPRTAFWAPITANRYLHLNEKGGIDDYFSSDYTDNELQQRLGHISNLHNLKYCLVACSGSDEYVPKSINIENLMYRICNAMNNNNEKDNKASIAIPLYIPTGNHNLSSENGTDATIFINKVQELLQNCIE